MQDVEFVKVTWLRALKVWWSLLWRATLLIILAEALVGFILGFFMSLAKAELETIKNVSTIAGYIVLIPIGIGIGIAVTKWVLGLRYSDFKIALVSEEDQY